MFHRVLVMSWSGHVQLPEIPYRKTWSFTPACSADPEVWPYWIDLFIVVAGSGELLLGRVQSILHAMIIQHQQGRYERGSWPYYTLGAIGRY